VTFSRTPGSRADGGEAKAHSIHRRALALLFGPIQLAGLRIGLLERLPRALVRPILVIVAGGPQQPRLSPAEYAVQAGQRVVAILGVLRALRLRRVEVAHEVQNFGAL